jgi:hypothetical protein
MKVVRLFAALLVAVSLAAFASTIQVAKAEDGYAMSPYYYSNTTQYVTPYTSYSYSRNIPLYYFPTYNFAGAGGVYGGCGGGCGFGYGGFGGGYGIY